MVSKYGQPTRNQGPVTGRSSGHRFGPTGIVPASTGGNPDLVTRNSQVPAGGGQYSVPPPNMAVIGNIRDNMYRDTGMPRMPNPQVPVGGNPVARIPQMPPPQGVMEHGAMPGQISPPGGISNMPGGFRMPDPQMIQDLMSKIRGGQALPAGNPGMLNQQSWWGGMGRAGLGALERMDIPETGQRGYVRPPNVGAFDSMSGGGPARIPQYF